MKESIGGFYALLFDENAFGNFQISTDQQLSIKFQHRGEAELRKIFDLSVEIKIGRTHQRPSATFENMIGDVIATFRNTTSAANRKFVRKNLIETSTSHSTSYSNIYSFNQAFLSFDILHPHFQDLNNKQRPF